MLEARARLRSGPARLALETGVPARTIFRILNRHHVPPLAWMDRITGAIIRATRAAANRYEHEQQLSVTLHHVRRAPRPPPRRR